MEPLFVFLTGETTMQMSRENSFAEEEEEDSEEEGEQAAAAMGVST